MAGDLDGDGRADLAGIGVSNTLWVMTDGAHWRGIPGWLSTLVIGDFYGDGTQHLAGLGIAQTIWRSPTLGVWEWLPGWLDTLVAGDLDGDGRDDLAGLSNTSIWVFRNGAYWEWLPGWLLTLDVDHQAPQHDALVGWNGTCWYRMPTIGVWQEDGCPSQHVAQ